MQCNVRYAFFHFVTGAAIAMKVVWLGLLFFSARVIVAEVTFVPLRPHSCSVVAIHTDEEYNVSLDRVQFEAVGCSDNDLTVRLHHVDASHSAMHAFGRGCSWGRTTDDGYAVLMEAHSSCSTETVLQVEVQLAAVDNADGLAAAHQQENSNRRFLQAAPAPASSQSRPNTTSCCCRGSFCCCDTPGHPCCPTVQYSSFGPQRFIFGVLALAVFVTVLLFYLALGIRFWRRRRIAAQAAAVAAEEAKRRQQEVLEMVERACAVPLKDGVAVSFTHLEDKGDEVEASKSSSLTSSQKVYLSEECPVCLQDITDRMLWRTFRCGHTICCTCLRMAVEHVSKAADIKCPICREYVLDMPREEVADARTNEGSATSSTGVAIVANAGDADSSDHSSETGADSSASAADHSQHVEVVVAHPATMPEQQVEGEDVSGANRAGSVEAAEPAVHGAVGVCAAQRSVQDDSAAAIEVGVPGLSCISLATGSLVSHNDDSAQTSAAKRAQ